MEDVTKEQRDMIEAMSNFIEKHESTVDQEIQDLRNQVEQLTQRVNTHDHSMVAIGHSQGQMDHRLDVHVDWIDQLGIRVADLEGPVAGAAAAPAQPTEDPQAKDEMMDEVIDP
jgi:uncharacterized coiled-coil protein SlyX